MVANTLKLLLRGAVGFIGWLGLLSHNVAKIFLVSVAEVIARSSIGAQMKLRCSSTEVDRAASDTDLDTGSVWGCAMGACCKLR